MESVSTKPSKRDAILDAMLDVVVERGFHDAPMSLIAERSGASAGVIYHHFASKSEIIQALYEKVLTLQRASFFAGYSPQMEAREAFIHVWLNGYRFYRKRHREMRFLEQCENAGFACPPAEGSPDAQAAAEFEQRFRSRSQGGVLNEWPKEVLREVTVGLVVRLARQPRKIPEPVLRDIAEKIWEAVRAKN